MNSTRAGAGMIRFHSDDKKKDKEKFQIDLDKYMHFQDKTCSDASKDKIQYIDRLRQLFLQVMKHHCDVSCNVPATNNFL